MAHHFSENLDNWKSEHAQGGGVIRFYGIHLIALLAELGYTDVNESFVIASAKLKECALWMAKCAGASLPDFDIEINTESNVNYFEIRDAKNDLLLFSSVSPFDHKQTLTEALEVDIRHAYLEQTLMENFSQNEVWPTRFKAALWLWEVVETCTRIKQSMNHQ